MKSIPGALAIWLLGCGVAQAQTSDMSITVSGFQLTANGAEKPAGVARRVRLAPTALGNPAPTAVFSMVGCGYFTVTPAPAAFEEKAHSGWRVEVTPMKVVDEAVTFRLRWVRALDTGSAVAPAGEDLELTLRPGESRPLDSVAVPAAARTFNDKPCSIKSASLRVSVDFDTLDRRLMVAEVWLVERLANGKEASQLQTVRSIPHQAVHFYFDSVTDGPNRFDLFGRLILDPKPGGVGIDVEAARAKADPGQDGYQAARWFRSKVELKPGETIEVALTRAGLDEKELIGRTFALRIRARQIR
jgi:hypothetical protein